MRIENPGHAARVVREAGRLRTAGALCDVVIAVGSRRFYAHKLVLACVSRTLEALFRQASLRYTLDFLQPSTFQQILDYAYTGCVDVCPDELPRLLQAAQLLQIDCLCTLCFGLARPGASDAIQNDGEPPFDNSPYPHREVESVAPAVQESERVQSYVSRPSTEFSTEQTPSVTAAGSVESVAPRPELPDVALAAEAMKRAGDTGETISAEDDSVALGLTKPHAREVRVMYVGGVNLQVMRGEGEDEEEDREGNDGCEDGEHRDEHDTPATTAANGVRQDEGFGVGTDSAEATKLAAETVVKSTEFPGRRSEQERGVQWSYYGTKEGSSVAYYASTERFPPPLTNTTFVTEGAAGAMAPLPDFSTLVARRLGAKTSRSLGTQGLPLLPPAPPTSVLGVITQPPPPRPVHLSTNTSDAGGPSLGMPRNSSPARLDTRPNSSGAEFSIGSSFPNAKPESNGTGTCQRQDVVGGDYFSPLRPKLEPQSHLDQSDASLDGASLDVANHETFCDSRGASPVSSEGGDFGRVAAATTGAILVKQEIEADVDGIVGGERIIHTGESGDATARRGGRRKRGERAPRQIERRVACEFCGARCRDEAALRAHRKAHGRERPHACQVCGKTFTLRHQLKTHYRVHTGEKPFECVLCGQRSRDHSAMTKHLRTHGGAKPYRCSLCRAFYPNMAAMQTHMTSHAASELPADWTIEDTYLYRHHAM
uniref:zinc finger and BTB domain-containing protein 16-A-like n=1 Tax=Myxine glutinosa TaxID=7769 RepID=UPI00358F8DBA